MKKTAAVPKAKKKTGANPMLDRHNKHKTAFMATAGPKAAAKKGEGAPGMQIDPKKMPGDAMPSWKAKGPGKDNKGMMSASPRTAMFRKKALKKK